MKKIIFAAVAIVVTVQPLKVRADEWSDGWCAGYQEAQKAMDRNRMHWRALLGEPVETSQQTLDRIYSKPWIGPLAPRTLNSPPGIPQNGPSLIDSIDLYVMLPQLPLNVHIIIGDKTIICSSPSS